MTKDSKKALPTISKKAHEALVKAQALVQLENPKGRVTIEQTIEVLANEKIKSSTL